MKQSIGQRICIIGLSSSGKSTLANNLAKKKGLDVLHLDQIAHIPNTDWKRCPIEETIAKHDKFIARENWVIDGCYRKFIPQRLARADTLIFMDFNRFSCLWNFIKRCFYSEDKRYGNLVGSTNKIKLSMIKYILITGPKKLSSYKELIKKHPHLNVIYLHSFKEVDDLLKNNLS